MAVGGLGPDVLRLVENWVPSQVYDHERKYHSELQDYLDEQLNAGGGGPMGALGGPSGSIPVTTEHGTSYGDVVVDETVGIELKRNFSNSQKKKLRGQLEDYAESYQYVIALACGVDDWDGWRELKGRYEGTDPFGMDATEFAFVAKERQYMGEEPPRNREQQGSFFDNLLGGTRGFF